MLTVHCGYSAGYSARPGDLAQLLARCCVRFALLSLFIPANTGSVQNFSSRLPRFTPPNFLPNPAIGRADLDFLP